MGRSTPVTALLLCTALAGCEEEERALPEPGTSPVQAVVAEIADGETSVGFVEVDNSGVRGDATLMAAGDLTQVRVELVGASGYGVHQGHLHEGTCEELGRPIEALTPVTTSEAGTGVVTSTVQMQKMDLIDGRHSIVYYEAGGNPGSPITCALIPEPES
jgi:hypothetical protein